MKISSQTTSIFAFGAALLLHFTLGKICPGFCVPDELCLSDGGKILGYCTNRRACCDVSHKLNRSTCGSSGVLKHPGTLQFVSPDYPGHSEGSLICSFTLQYPESMAGIHLELTRFELEPKEPNGLKCDSDMFLIKGFSDWMPDPLCGYLSGYSVLIELNQGWTLNKGNLNLLFIASSHKYRWKLRILAVTKAKRKKSELCVTTRFENWRRSPHFPQGIPLDTHQSSPHIDMHLQESNDPWKWHVDIVTDSPENTRCWKKTTPENPRAAFPEWHKLCSGTILDDRHVLIPASCLLIPDGRPERLERVKIVTAAFCPVVNERGSEGHFLEVETVFLHFNYVASIRHKDVAVIRTRKTIRFGEKVQPISFLGGTNEPRHLAFALQGPGLDRIRLHPIVPSSKGSCSQIYAESLHLSPMHLEELQGSSGKYRQILKSQICFPGVFPPSLDFRSETEDCPHKNAYYGRALLGLNPNGTDLHLQGMLTQLVIRAGRPGAVVHNTSGEPPLEGFVYFSLMEWLRPWILMALA